MENLKSNGDEDIEKICIAFGVSKAALKLSLTKLEYLHNKRNRRRKT